MAKDLRFLNVVDVEATCWDNEPPKGMLNEIIEIGIAVLDLRSADLKIIDSRAIIVFPEKSTISEFCTELTTLTPEFVERKGIAFHRALAILKSEYDSMNRTWASWGDYDRTQFERQCGRSNVRTPFGPTHLNLKNFFALKTGLKKEIGLDKALDKLGLTMVGTHHRGVDDAINIARIAAALLVGQDPSSLE